MKLGKYITIDCTTFSVPYISLKRNADVLDKYAKRTADGVLRREIIGVYYNYTIGFGSFTDMQQYNALWNKLTEPEEFHTITLPAEMGSFTFSAYISSVSDQFDYIGNDDDVRIISGLTAKFTAQAPARVPS